MRLQVVNEQQETHSTPGISSNIQNGTIVEARHTGAGTAASRQRVINAVEFATGPFAVVIASGESHSVRLTNALPHGWQLNNNRGEINVGGETSALNSERSGDLQSSTSRGGL